jgi:hypothetical protein
MGAGPVPEILHRVLIALSWLVRGKVISTLAPMATLMHWATNHLRWGEHRGGMFVEVEGLDGASAPVRRSWHLIAEHDDGPLIPSMAVEAIAHRILAGLPPAPGARAATRDLDLSDFEALFAGRAIFTGVREDTASTDGLYRQILGDAYEGLPAEIRELHGARAGEGVASVERGKGLLSTMAARIIGFPKASSQIPVRVTFDRAGGREIWTRAFGAQQFKSEEFAGNGRADRLLVEKFGPLEFAMALVVEGSKLSLKLRRWTAFGVPMPLGLAPRSQAFESAIDGVFHFDVTIGHPLAGLIVRYRGWLKPVGAR